jgi:hypothetical protein
MSIPVDLARLDEQLARFGANAFVLTTSDDGRPHISHVSLTLEGGVLRDGSQHRVASAGRDPVAAA